MPRCTYMQLGKEVVHPVQGYPELSCCDEISYLSAAGHCIQHIILFQLTCWQEMRIVIVHPELLTIIDLPVNFRQISINYRFQSLPKTKISNHNSVKLQS